MRSDRITKFILYGLLYGIVPAVSSYISNYFQIFPNFWGILYILVLYKSPLS
jgi:hypothetical protein